MNVVWFKRDLRLADHAPLAAAIERGEPLLLLYIVEPTLLGDPHYRGRHWHFIAQSLQAMNDELAMLGAQIQVLEGEPVSLLNRLHQSQPICHLYSHEETGLGVTFERDRQVAAFCAAQGIAWHEYQTNGIQRGRCDRRGWNGAWQRVMSDAEIPLDLNTLPRLCQPLPAAMEGARSERIEGWVRHNAAFQHGGAVAGNEVLQSFLEVRGHGYQRHISKPAGSRVHCSRLSPYLAWGNLSLRQAYRALKKRQDQGGWTRALAAFESRLHWHCHFIQKFEMECRMEFEDLNRGYLAHPRRHDPDRVDAWREGRTGYPLIDACMRCLMQTGYLNFRARAMVVSFLTHHLWQNWRLGEIGRAHV